MLRGARMNSSCGSHDGRSSRQRVGRGVIGVLARGKRLLVVCRAPAVRLAGYWCFPGGHIEPGEISREAIRREVAEELGIVVAPAQRIGAVRTDDNRYVLAVWRVEHLEGDLRPDPDEVSDVAWLTPVRIRALQPGLRSTLRVLELLGV